MGDRLPEQLYTTWRSEQPDPTAHPSWGNVDADTRRTWETVARIAREQLAARFVTSMREVCTNQVTAAEVIVKSAGSVLWVLESWAR